MKKAEKKHKYDCAACGTASANDQTEIGGKEYCPACASRAPIPFNDLDRYVLMRMGAQCIDPECRVCPREVAAQAAVHAALAVCKALVDARDGKAFRRALIDFETKARKVSR